MNAMNDKLSVEAFLAGIALVPIPEKSVINVLQCENNFDLGVLNIGDDTSSFMHKFFVSLLKKRITRATKVCLVIRIPSSRSMRASEMEEFVSFISSWTGNLELYWGLYVLEEVKGMQIAVLSNKPKDEK